MFDEASKKIAQLEDKIDELESRIDFLIQSIQADYNKKHIENTDSSLCTCDYDYTGAHSWTCLNPKGKK